MRALLGEPLDDGELRTRLEELAVHPAFPGFTWWWGPELYRRNRALFRPLILSRFGTWRMKRKGVFVPVRFNQRLAQWLEQVDRDDDVELFRRLWTWKLIDSGGWLGTKADKTYRQELATRMAVLSRARLAIELRKLDVHFTLDEPTALRVYQAAGRHAGDYILRHLPWFWQRGGWWEKLFQVALKEGDERFAWELYRRTVDAKRWEKDVLELGGPNLLSELEKRHPRYLPQVGAVMHKLLERRGREVLPYVLRHLDHVWQGWLLPGSYARLLDLARQKGWLDLWAGLLRVSARPQEFNQEIRRLLEDRHLDDQETLRRLLALAGVSREWNLPGLGLAQVKQLEEATALELYGRYPGLLRGPFRLHLQLPPWGPGYPRLVKLLITAGEEELVDFLAARYLAFSQPPAEIDVLADYYERRKGDSEFARRAARVLGLVPAYGLPHYSELMSKNRLTRLLFGRSLSSFLEDEGAVADLVEASEIHVQALAYRVLALPQARALAVVHLTLLLGTLLRPLHRATRALAFEALANAARHDLETARTVLERARDALTMPDQRYPREKLIGLIAAILHRWPELRGPREHPVIYREHVVSV